jgi:signal transduction histidine kinase
MSARLAFRLTAPIVAISLLLLAGGVTAAWYVQRLQKRLASEVLVNANAMRAAEELEFLVREARTRLDAFRITRDRKFLRQTFELRRETEQWLAQTEEWALSEEEKSLTRRVRQGQERFWRDLRRIAGQAPPDQAPAEVGLLIQEVLVPEVQNPAHAYLDLNEKEVEEAVQRNQVFSDRLVYALLLFASCGALAGFMLARALVRSLVQLSVLVRDAAGRLDAVDPVTFSGRDLGELESVLRLVSERVQAIVERLQRREREALHAEQLAAVGQLAAGMAHELRNPLMSMKLLVQGAMDDAWDSARLSPRDLGVLEEEITRLERLVQSFLDFARPPAPEKRVQDVRPLVEQSLAVVAARAAAAGAKVETVLPAEPAYAAVDPGQFRQVMLNLVLNALDAMPGGGALAVILQQRDGWLTLQTADTGRGLPADLGERIFEPFTTTKETGLGLGLSICRRIVAAHGGTLTAANRPGGGALFTIRLPAARP